MPKTRIPSPARSQGTLLTPRRSKRRGTRSVGSPAGSTTSGRMTAVIQFNDKHMSSFVLSPANRRSILTDDTDIEEPRRKSWWKKLNENSRDVMEVLEGNNDGDTNIEELIDIEVLSQEKKQYTLDLPDSSDSESISSIVIPQRKLFTQKESHPQKNFAQILGNRESLAKINKTNVLSQDKTINAGTKNLFNQRPKRSKPVFPAALLNISANKTAADKTKELIPEEPKTQVRNIFGNRPATKRKNIFADFIASESEDEIPEIQPKVFEFPKKVDKARGSNAARVVRDHSPTSSLTADLEMDDWKLLPSSTMVENQLEEMFASTPVKRARLSRLSEAKDSEIATVTSINRSRNSTRSATSKNKSKSLNKLSEKDLNISKDAVNPKEINMSVEKRKQNKTQSIIASKDAVDNSRNKSKLADTSKQQTEIEVPVNVTHKSLSKSIKNAEQNAKDGEEMEDIVTEQVDNDDENNFTLEYENDEVEMEEEVNDKSITQEHSQSVNNDDDCSEEQNENDINKSDQQNILVVGEYEEEARAESIENVSQNEEVDGNEEDQLAVPNESDEQGQQESEGNTSTENVEDIEDNQMEVEDECANESEVRNDDSDNIEDQGNKDDNLVENEPALNEINAEKSNIIQNTSGVDVSHNKSKLTNTSNVDEQDDALVESDHQIETDQEEDGDDIETDQDQRRIEESNENEQSDQESLEETDEECEQNDLEDEGNVQSEEEEEEEDDELSEVEDQEISDVQEQNESDADKTEQNISSENVEVEETDELEDDIEDPNVSESEQDDVEDQNDGRVESEVVSQEEIDGTPDKTHDTTGRNRQKITTKVKSPEAILHDKTNQIDSFSVHGRNTSIRKTKSMKNLNIRPSMAPIRESIGFSDGTKDSSAEGSGWDSHRTTRKTIRQTMGKDFSIRKSLRALVMEKSAKRRTEFNEDHTEIGKLPQANSTEFPEESNRDMDVAEYSNREDEPVESVHEVSRNTRQTTLEMYLQKIKKQNLEQRIRIEEAVRSSLKAPSKDVPHVFKVPARPPLRKAKAPPSKPKSKPKSLLFAELPIEVVEDMKYKPPKRFQPSNASWITKRLYKFLEGKLEAKYDYKARVRAEKLVETIYYFTKELRRLDVASTDAVDVLKHEMARLDIVQTHFDFYQFFHDFMPKEIKVKVVPDIVNGIQLPRHGVFTDILRGVQG